MTVTDIYLYNPGSYDIIKENYKNNSEKTAGGKDQS
jgi:hypothetical protein